MLVSKQVWVDLLPKEISMVMDPRKLQKEPESLGLSPKGISQELLPEIGVIELV